ncbi:MULTISPECIES: sodium/proline symporter PutP [unclassified Lentimonas]|uniref:sodium/proline symporter PutP n=1 Tax=unclassified Lentimonas TaxID=2630993 RepID=UPI001325539F|nr:MULTISPECIES: sodium/proline symporter PutP [unclassified Lentimonas]CAA6679169.1 Proline/sodium symporter PutP (TC 2.A.21.2.1) @ Propionate/sodium symporter [Lentimonas sp. CC4]CAA6684087.1 Proline/sodium symporter PutP (TC 2.A.21.2.1) @ Propionate/sodium symporter [Lentimonas sp. CC6]CAA7076537.1 Proline/sodium symporter PutP (TC 2.A.21.2.1) @ Propionate/sodium symporter [Lentimonas sp. CC4]CAA7172102.1 Proline/sodium symporter PutP (TC 2.A.21.2.1) @ Propionate/sodium symporter [Lentimonas
MEVGIWISLFLYFGLMIAIGFYAARKSTSSSEEYMLGGRQLHPAVAALSAGASDMSGWLLLGLPGALFAAGLIEAWIGIGLLVGAWLNWMVVAPRLREQTERYDNALTIPQFLANRFPSKAMSLRTVSAVIVVVFFVVYTASGLVGGGKLFASAFGDLINLSFMSDYTFGVWFTLGVVLVYTVIGGFMAVSLTDFVQGCIMMLALVIMPLVILTTGQNDGLVTTVEQLNAIDPHYLSLFDGLTFFGFLSAVGWGLGYFGQPHIIVRFMAVRSVADVAKARNIGMSWMFISLLGAVGIGILGRAYVERSGITISDGETIFIVLANLLFHPLITGCLYAALLAAIMSTISSQLLVSSSSLTEDFYRLFMNKKASQGHLVTVGRVSVVLVGVIAALMADDPNSQILKLVSNAWAGFGAAFGPLIILSLTWKKMSGTGAVAGMLTGAVTVIAWINMGWSSSFLGGPGIYEIIPGFILAWLAIVLVSRRTHTEGEFRPIPRD